MTQEKLDEEIRQAFKFPKGYPIGESIREQWKKNGPKKLRGWDNEKISKKIGKKHKWNEPVFNKDY
jgi:hypothetical protein